ncbi:MAG: DUF2062 domain-containing protein [Candidatus Brocadiia bacterium]|nr:DUF2062 domain-containing protein [Candidatus Brocadiia bacterium]
MLRTRYQKFYAIWYRLVTLRSSPRKVAGGLALGIFVSLTPTFGVQMPIAVAVAALLRVNAASTLVGVYLTNVVTVWPLYVLCYRVGRLVVGGTPADEVEFSSAGGIYRLLEMGQRGIALIGTELIGAIIVGALAAPCVYFLTLFGVVRYRRARLNRRIQKMRRRLEQTNTATTDCTWIPKPPATRRRRRRASGA